MIGEWARGGDTLIDRWDWQQEKRQRDISPIRGTQVTPTEQTSAPPICGRNIDQSVVAGVPNGVPIAPSSVTAINLAANPYPSTPPSFQTAPHNAGNTGVFDYVGSGSGAYDAITSFIIAAPPSMPGQTLGIKPPWLDYVRMYAVTTGSAFNTLTGVGIGAAVTDITARTDGTYTNIRIPGLSAGTQYDIYAAYVDHSGQPGAAVLIGTTNSNPLAVTPGQMPGVPAGLAFTAATTINSYGGTNAGAYSVNCTSNVVITANGGTVAQWLTEAQIFTSTDGSNWSYNTRVATTGVGNLSYTLDGLGAGQVYHIAVQLKAVNGTVSTLVDTGAVTVAQTIGNPAMSTMPSAIKTNGPTISTASASTRTNRAGMIQSMTVSFTETDFTAKPSWIDKIILTVRINGDTGGSNQVQIDPGTSTSGVYSNIFIPVTRGDTVDIGITYSDTSGQFSATVWPSALSAQADAGGDVWDPSNRNLLIFGRNSTAVQSTHLATAGSDGSYLNSNVLSRRHIMGGVSSSEGAGNLLYNPTGAFGTTNWATYQSSGTGMTFSTDRFQGGRFIVTGVTGAACLAQQLHYLEFANGPMTVSGYYEMGSKGAGATNGCVYIDVIGDGGFANTTVVDVRSGSITQRTFFSKTFTTTPTQTYVYVRIWGGDGGTNFGQSYYYRMKLEYGSVATPYSDDFSDALVLTAHNADSSLMHSLPNMLPNSDFAISGDTVGGGLGTGTVPLFWTPYNNASANFAYALDTGAAPPVGVNAWKVTNNSGAVTTNVMGLYCGTNNIDGSANQLLYANRTYVFSYYAKASVAGAPGFMSAANAGCTVTNLTPLIPQTSSTSWQRYAFLLTVGGANYQGGIFAAISNGLAAGASIWLAGMKLEEGSNLSAWTGPSPAGGTMIDLSQYHNGNLRYTNQSTEYRGNWDGGGNLKTSAGLKNQGSIIPVTTPSVSSAGSYPSGGTPTVTISWSAGTYYFPDNTSISIAAGSTPFSGLTAGATYYFTVYATTAGVVTVTNIGTSPPNTQQKFNVNLDGRIPLSSQISCATPSSVGGSSSGGGGGGTTCPSEDQLMRTRERGLIAARDVRVGMHVLGPGGVYVRVEAVRYALAQMMRLTAHGETFEVDTQHLWRTTEGWVRMCDISLNMLLVDSTGRLHPVERVEMSTIKTMCMIRVVGGELSLGSRGLVAHNYGTL